MHLALNNLQRLICHETQPNHDLPEPKISGLQVQIIKELNPYEDFNGITFIVTFLIKTILNLRERKLSFYYYFFYGKFPSFSREIICFKITYNQWFNFL